MKPALKPALALSSLALLGSLTAGCHSGNDEAAGNCTAGTRTSFSNKAEFLGVPFAEDGAACLDQPAIAGLPYLGVYEYDDFGERGEPKVVLRKGAHESSFQTHGVTAREIEWDILVSPDGRPVAQTGPGGAIVYLFFKYLTVGHFSCTPGIICDPEANEEVTTDMGVWQAAQLSISFEKARMAVYGERLLDCANADPGQGSSCATGAFPSNQFWTLTN